MSQPCVEREPATLWLAPVVTWVALLVLLGLSALIAFLPLGGFKAVANLAIAVVQAAGMAVIFMRLDRSSALVRLSAAAGFLWIVFMFVFTFADYFTRP